MNLAKFTTLCLKTNQACLLQNKQGNGHLTLPHHHQSFLPGTIYYLVVTLQNVTQVSVYLYDNYDNWFRLVGTTAVLVKGAIVIIKAYCGWWLNGKVADS